MIRIVVNFGISRESLGSAGHPQGGAPTVRDRLQAYFTTQYHYLIRISLTAMGGTPTASGYILDLLK